MEPFKLATDSHCSGFVMIFSEVRWSLGVTWVFVRRFEPLLWFLALDLCWWAGFTPFFLLLIRILWNPSPLLLLLLWSNACDHACSVLPPVACSRLNSRFSSSMMKIPTTLRTAWNYMNFVWILLLFGSVSWIQWRIWSFLVKLLWIGAEFELGFVCVLELFVNLLSLICNCQEREKWILLVMRHWFYRPSLWLVQ